MFEYGWLYRMIIQILWLNNFRDFICLVSAPLSVRASQFLSFQRHFYEQQTIQALKWFRRIQNFPRTYQFIRHAFKLKSATSKRFDSKLVWTGTRPFEPVLSGFSIDAILFAWRYYVCEIVLFIKITISMRLRDLTRRCYVRYRKLLFS